MEGTAHHGPYHIGLKVNKRPTTSTEPLVPSGLRTARKLQHPNCDQRSPAMVERFFFGKKRGTDGEDSGDFMLLSGPPSCGKTSLLFQFAFNCAVESNSENRDVVFICTRRRLEHKPPYLSQGIDPSSDIFLRIQMKYVEDEEGIKKYFAAFHLHHPFPIAVIIDDFGDFFDERNCQEKYKSPRGRDLAMVRTLALCRSAITHANKTGPCKILLSDTHHGDFPRLLFIYKRWIPSIFTIKGDRSGSFLVKNSINSGSRSTGRTKIAKYSIALQYLFLEEIKEDNEK